MDARAQTVRGILHSPVRYLIPLFQRHYAWRKQNWQRLLGDLWTLLNDEQNDSQHSLRPLVCTPMIDDSTTFSYRSQHGPWYAANPSTLTRHVRQCCTLPLSH